MSIQIQEVLQGSRQWWIELGDAGQVLPSLPDGCAAAVYADPPWLYNQGGTRDGAAKNHYNGLTNMQIAGQLQDAYAKAQKDAYFVCWCTFPKLAEWLTEWAAHERRVKEGKIATWRYTTGGSWHKDTGMGVGYHLRGDAELFLFYTKGAPKCNITMSNAYRTPRPAHSFKPASILAQFVRLATQPGDLVLDLYAGNSGNLARVCQQLGRRYIGIEIDPRRHNEALMRLSQQEMEMAV
jgi:adenine-specific DNA-methyltransferase